MKFKGNTLHTYMKVTWNTNQMQHSDVKLKQLQCNKHN